MKQTRYVRIVRMVLVGGSAILALLGMRELADAILNATVLL